MAANQQFSPRPIMVIAAVLCAVLFVYVILSQKHHNTSSVNPGAYPLDKQILSDTQVALPLRHKAPAKFGTPSTSTPTAGSSTVAPANGGFVSSPSTVAPLVNNAYHSNLPPLINPGHPIVVNTAAPPVSSTSTATSKSNTASRATANSTAPTGKPIPAIAPLSTSPAYTVLIKTPGDRARKAVVVNE